MRLNTLNHALPIVAAAYGRQFGVAVHVGGDTACTDGRTIQIPQLVDDPIAKTLAWGYLAHEAGHVRHTDFNVWPDTAQHTALTRTITNILEDVRIEQAMLRDYPGTRQTLDAVLDWMLAKGQISAPTPHASPPTVFANSLLVLARYRYRQQAMLATVASQAEQVLRQVFPARFVHRLLGLMTAIPQLGSTAEAVDLAQRIIALMEEETQAPVPHSHAPTPAADARPGQQEAPVQTPPESSGEVGADADDGDPDDQGGDGADAPQTEDQSTQGAEHDGQDSGSVADDGDAGAEAESCAAGSKMDTDRDRDAAVSAAGSAVAQTLSANADAFPEDLFTQLAAVLDTHSQASPTLMPTLERSEGPQDQGQALLQQVRTHSATLTTRLQALVESQTRTRSRIVRAGRHLSGAHLHRAGVGDPRLFRRTDARRAPNTAIHLLVDLSSSMRGYQDRLALEAAMALALALEPIRGVSRAVTAFPGRQGDEAQVTQLLAHGERVARRSGAFVQRGRGSTPMTGALWFATADLLARPEPRKVLLTLTDGIPNDLDSARALIKQAGSAGIELIGVGIAHDVSRVFPLAIRIEAIATLKQALFQVAEQLLLWRRP
ncbi:VWA domain-containing protein [Lamprobacter modestohalophilus]|uniref:VWA domain-containing protein n=1 Tax=Lamprobacter modestohalophilus TaxID=1064514 RepID=A0A9X0W862_9GAMM|nr:VWA domain-containing protein [Lamprobacter modestohalophilus]MBK1618592.1 VWA domain-containing protein [Lamprobacter modestohalophilus]